MKEESIELIASNNEFIGYHGTSEASAALILNSNFQPSKNPDDWLGYGIYFFVEGISDPIENAVEWAKNKAWNNADRSLDYSTYNVLSVSVSGKNILDTTKTDGLRAFNGVREALQKAEKKAFKRDRNRREDDRVIWNLVADFLQLEIIIHNLYIKTKLQRQLSIASNVPNVTVMCVKAIGAINIKTIKMVKHGVIEQ